jgi:hypothetical protein
MGFPAAFAYAFRETAARWLDDFRFKFRFESRTDAYQEATGLGLGRMPGAAERGVDAREAWPRKE